MELQYACCQQLGVYPSHFYINGISAALVFPMLDLLLKLHFLLLEKAVRLSELVYLLPY